LPLGIQALRFMRALFIAFVFTALTVAAGGVGVVASQPAPHEQWLQERLNEARSIKVGSTFGELAKRFRFDGGPNGNSGSYRCDLVSCPSIKLDVMLVDSSGKKISLSIFDKIPPETQVSSISKPYLEEPITD
jgi:hypothetical protein